MESNNYVPIAIACPLNVSSDGSIDAETWVQCTGSAQGRCASKVTTLVQANLEQVKTGL